MPEIDLIAAWESSLQQPTPWRGVALLAGSGIDAPQDLDLGRREAALLAVYRRTVGERLDCEAQCPACGERLEFAIPASELPAGASADAGPVRQDGWEVALRVPTTPDVAWALGEPDPDAALFGRCVVSALHHGAARAPDGIPGPVRDRCEQRLDALAPLADLEIELACPACAHSAPSPLDVGAYVLAALQQWVERRLEEVARLCLAYGWGEAEVLAMSGWRRAFYLARAEDR